jgi:hypothetical protein
MPKIIDRDNSQYEEAIAAHAIKQICFNPGRPPLPRDIVLALAKHEMAESRVRIAREKLKWKHGA